MTAQELDENPIRTLIRILRDGERGFHEIGDRLQEPEYQRFYFEEGRVRAAFAAELERGLAGIVGGPIQEEGTAIGTLHRGYLELKAAFGAGDQELLSDTRRCERVAVRVYEQSLSAEGLPDALRSIIARQAEHVRRVYELLQRFQEETRG